MTEASAAILTQKMEQPMRTLQAEEIEIIAGGILPILIGILAFEWHEADHLRSFFDGVFDGAGGL